MRIIILALALLGCPTVVWACGGFFCNNNEPIKQAAERIIFVPDDDTMHMHVEIQYKGPAEDFGWLLPVPAGVEVGLSGELIFDQLDAFFTPQFLINAVTDSGCPPARGMPDASAGPTDGGTNPPEVRVVSRQSVGPYDQATLEAASVDVLRSWLDENDFQVPPAIDEKLGPYVEAGAVFVAIKLLPGRSSGDITPVHLEFPSRIATIPIIPTSVAAEKDMGMIVHVLGPSRAISLNYLHVSINEAALDLRSGGANYQDVVSQAVDEAEGHAFTTDYAGAIPEDFKEAIMPLEEGRIARHSTPLDIHTYELGYWNDPDFRRILAGHMSLPEDFDLEAFWNTPFDYPDQFQADVDFRAVAEDIVNEVNPARRAILRATRTHPYLTRLFTTLSAEEMTVDPIFAFNPDLPEVPRDRQLEVRLNCDGNATEVITTDGRTVSLENGSPVRRENGVTVEGQDTPAAALIEYMYIHGPPEALGGLGTAPGGPLSQPGAGTAVVSNDNSGCDCAVQQASPISWLLLFAGVLGLWRRRRS